MADLTLDIAPGHAAVEVVAHLNTGLGYDPPYGLDLAGLLATRVRLLEQQRRHDEGRLVSHPLPDTTEEEVYDLRLPLSRCRTGSEWHWLASCVIPVDPLPDPEPRTYYRTVDYSWAQRAAKRPLPHYLSPSSGAYRDVMMPAPVVVCGRATWRCVGDREQIEALLRGVRFIGRRRSTGEGGVLFWEVREVDEDPGTWGHLQGREITRPCPQECAEALGLEGHEWRLGHYAIRPPSWHPDRLMPLAMAMDEEEW